MQKGGTTAACPKEGHLGVPIRVWNVAPNIAYSEDETGLTILALTGGPDIVITLSAFIIWLLLHSEEA
jgi:hypothetical protein